MKLIEHIFESTRDIIRSCIINGECWFVAVDVCRALGLNNTTAALRGLDEDEKITLTNDKGNPRAGIAHEMTLISESGLYELIIKSRKPQARKFSKWVTRQVLPSIRKTGGYSTGGQIADSDMARRLLIEAETSKTAIGLLNLIQPKHAFGSLGPNGQPRTGIRSASYVSAPCRKGDAIRFVGGVSLLLEPFLPGLDLSPAA